MKETKHKWAVKAANKFAVTIATGYRYSYSALELDAEKMHKRLVALQLRAYKRGFKDGYAKVWP